ncbi:uncharacterized protein N0V89_008876 [Didymosphaeria variabile]|uniref:Uncharacterized protein n=1 Tax=Didymosphaeria variabile TaxID=1932322 RepID=A0A9W9C883_9PLEO|nr:uncharacterized protein N0V89_008876 [Didymosphaeria variabile]KAJ4350255.1 hypothetical protein N0V89_008876 [Didymosphaeria variabile]
MMTSRTNDQLRPTSRRGASGAWRRGDRLKPAPADTLELLNDFRTQEFYFSKLIERYMRLCAINQKQLSTLFASITLNDAPSTNALGLPLPTAASAPPDTLPTSPPNFNSPPINDLATVLSAFRKLREAIIASGRKDAFARRAYFFGIHAAILCKDWASYLPALTYLLTVLHAATPLSPPDLKEYVGLLVLDQACRQGDIALAHETRLRYAYKDRRVELVLKALVADNWVVFWKMKKAVDGYQRSVMEFAEQGVRLHALKCLGRGYLSADKRFVERSVERAWAELVKDGVGWELTEEDTVVIKKPKGK